LYLGEKGGKSILKKNLAKERMQKIRKSLNIDKEKFKEMCNTDLVTKKAPQKFSRSLPNSSSKYIRYLIFCAFDKVLKHLFTLFSIFTLFCVYRL